jgi:hypothetical protein
MATDKDTLIFQREGTTIRKDLYSDFGIKTTSVPLFVPGDTKELPSRDWSEEDGLDVYVPNIIPLKAYIIDVSVVYSGEQGSFQSKLDSLASYLLTGGSYLNIYSPYSSTSCKGAHFVGFSDFSFTSDSSTGDIAEFKIKFKVTKPKERFTL